MIEQLKALEERLYSVQQEYLLAKERHEFLAQYDLYEEWKQLKKQQSELKSQLGLN
ncbi:MULTISPECIES: hypothetical protein [Thermoactinomyces]|uniref:Uncharacterized protein n=3 Tax=Thermoactinomyces TaxID=2023 RepID=A0A8I1AD34_THEIN|nr:MULTISPECIES: hypothetical protein [Thermoactinomyces]MBA4547916.1 hypothetical protein [Thermoactinomyces intermedius]MBA4550795.1 hypothetical protein [Thermoactinomyces vulgaris]MBA4596146.1 hypothetical protein [Thermoactinomyces vulgaris]MBA4835942.1 hypothetical protein [Thermoactinomyces intermedius]MBH8583119.1 hypothetical protein [Thermoactinomyces sp. CICC 10735]